MRQFDDTVNRKGAILFYGGGGLAQEMLHTLHIAESNYTQCVRLLVDNADQDLPHFTDDAWIRFQQVCEVVTYVTEHGIETLFAYVCVRDARIRIRMVAEMADLIAPACKLVFPTLLHPNASISRTAVLERGVYVGPYCHVGPNVYIRQFATLTACVIIGHGSTIGDFCHCGPICCISGDVKIDARVTLGAGSRVREKCKVIKDTIIGMGATVTKSIEVPGIYCGTPALLQKPCPKL